MITSRAELLESLKGQLRRISGLKKGAGPDCAQHPSGRSDDRDLTPLSTELSGEKDVVSTGLPALDGLLPQAGIPRGGLVEWLAANDGAGRATVALAGVRAALQDQGYWVVIDPQGEFYPPAALGWGISAERLLLVRPTTPRDAAWAFEQALRCPGVAVAWNWVGAVSDRILRRWKVAAEVGRGQGVLFRSERALRDASWADVRWIVKPVAQVAESHKSSVAAGSLQGRATLSPHSNEMRLPSDEVLKKGAGPDCRNGPEGTAHNRGLPPFSTRRLRLELAYCRGCLGGDRIEVECDHETGLVRVVPELAHSTLLPRAVRA